MSKSTISTFQLFERFPDERAARKHLEEKRWGGNPACPHCGNKERIQDRRLESYYRCLACKVDFTVRTGTIFERSHVPLHKWIYALYLIVTSRKGISSLQLAKEIGVTQKTAWFMLQRIRESCGNNKDDDGGNGFLKGVVEADETYIGGKESNKHSRKKLHAGRGAVGKVAVLGIRERGGSVRARVLKNTSQRAIHEELNSTIVDGSTLCTDEHRSYLGNKFNHRVVNHSAKQFVDGMAHTNGIESVWAVLKRGFYGVYHSFSEKHLQRYVDEFAYRLNEGNCKVHTLDRMDALLCRTIGKRITFAELTLA